MQAVRLSVSGDLDISGNNATLYLCMHHLSLSGVCDSWIRDVVDLELYMYVHVTS